MNYIKKKIMAFKDIFKEENHYNEKNIVGFASFAVMVIFALTDIITSVIGNTELIISESIYNSFVIVTLGSFGISEIPKIVHGYSKDIKKEEK
jgi:hypothetical protein